MLAITLKNRLEINVPELSYQVTDRELYITSLIQCFHFFSLIKVIMTKVTALIYLVYCYNSFNSKVMRKSALSFTTAGFS